MFLNKFVQNLVSNFFNLIIVELFYQPVQDVSLYPEISFVNVWNVIFIVHQGWETSDAKTGRFLLISNLGTNLDIMMSRCF